MLHSVHIAGDGHHIVWAHKDADGVQTALESRSHASIYDGLVTDEESTYVAAHVGLFWCIGTFRIKNDQDITMAVSEKRAPSMFSYKSNSKLVAEKIHFIDQLCKQRGIGIKYMQIDAPLNYAEVELARICAQ